MDLDKNPDLQEVLEASARSKPQRTYSHKGRTSRAVSLPALKPAWNTPTLANTANSGLILTPSLLVTSPMAPTSHSPSPPDSGDSNALEPDEDEEDDILVLSGQSFAKNTKHDRRTGNGTRSLRRRPFLLFARTEAKGYKQLKNKPPPAETPEASRYQPGDGFSGREAKPNGSALLSRTGKLSTAGAPVGILDLTQSERAPTKQKRSFRRADLDDNSFVVTPKKKARRALQPKDPNQLPKPAKAAPAPVKKSSSVLGPAKKALKPPETPKSEANLASEKQGQEAGNLEKLLHRRTSLRFQQHNEAEDDDNDDDDEVDLLIIDESDGTQDNPGPASDGRGTAAGEGQDSCESHVTDSPQRQVRIRARSAPPESPLQHAMGCTPLPDTLVRRYSTQ
ncbi:hypothetical protein N658DRAFT_429261 [Parathielavia hyrcaniae]|uniref:Uncharacterized protein n=1 Tax=Parathielavia hyrcaniae TaxID=113614 RepID=A0AAN6Q2C6_9PEZI|nr:hypothetical protein N658DRAFT_429261 [Parathielavia hyrcaniae]